MTATFARVQTIGLDVPKRQSIFAPDESRSVDLKTAIAFVRTGCPLRKYCRTPFQKPHDRHFHVDFDSLLLIWTSPAKPSHRTQINLATVTAILSGPQSGYFNKRETDERDLGIEIVSSRRRLRLVCSRIEDHELWVRGLTYARSKALAKSQETRTVQHPMIRKLWETQPLTEAGTMHYRHVLSLLETIGISADVRYVKQLFDANLQEGSSTIEYEEFCKLLENIVAVPELIDVFNVYQDSESGRIGLNDFRLFLKDVQQASDVEIEEWLKFISHLPEAFRSEDGLTFLGFCYVLTDGTRNGCLNPSKLTRYQDMSQPLQHYWISSSFLSAVDSTLLRSPVDVTSRLDMLLREGCRSLHLDIVESSRNCEPAVSQEPYSQHSTPLETVLLYLRDNAFKETPYPLFLHLSLETTRDLATATAQVVGQVLQGRLATRENMMSPESLKCRFVLCTSASGVDVNDQADGQMSTRRRQLKLERGDRGLTENVAPLCNPPLHPLSPRAVPQPKKVLARGSLSRRGPLSGAALLLREYAAISVDHFTYPAPEDKPYDAGLITAGALMQAVSVVGTSKLVAHHNDNLTWVVPPTVRGFCTDLDPSDAWFLGAQMVAVPWHMCGRGRLVNLARFAENGNCGFVLKPRSPETGIHLVLKIMCARQLFRPAGLRALETLQPFVTLRVKTNAKETQVEQGKIGVDHQSRFVWEGQVFSIMIPSPSSSILVIEVFHHDAIKPVLVGCAAMTVGLMRNGLRWLPLLDPMLRPVPWSGMLIDIQLKPPRGRALIPTRRSTQHDMKPETESRNSPIKIKRQSLVGPASPLVRRGTLYADHQENKG